MMKDRMNIRLLLADDHPLILNGLEFLLGSEQDMNVVARCVDGDEVLPMVRQHNPDILLLDISMSGKDSFEIIRGMEEERLPTRTVLLTRDLDMDKLLAAMRPGMWGVVPKMVAPQLLVQCIRKVHSGEPWMERCCAARVLEKVRLRESGGQELSALLTPREVEIARLVTKGLRNKEVAATTVVSVGTVKKHLHNIYGKLNVDGRMALLRLAQQKGIL